MRPDKGWSRAELNVQLESRVGVPEVYTVVPKGSTALRHPRLGICGHASAYGPHERIDVLVPFPPSRLHLKRGFVEDRFRHDTASREYLKA